MRCQILLGFADVLADHTGQVDPVQIQAQLACQDIGRHGLAGARRTGEQGAQAFAQGQLALEAPGFQHLGAITNLVAHLVQASQGLGRQDDILPGVMRRDALGQKSQARTELHLSRGGQVAELQVARIRIAAARQAFSSMHGSLDLARSKTKALGNPYQIQRIGLAVEPAGPQPQAHLSVGQRECRAGEFSLIERRAACPGGLAAQDRKLGQFIQGCANGLESEMMLRGEELIESRDVQDGPL